MTRKLARLALTAGLAALTGASALAQSSAPHGQHGAMPQAQSPVASANHTEMMRQMTAMSRSMAAAPMTGDPDRDLVTMMIPHHQGAIDMARIYLREGRDPTIRQMAETIIVDQEREIAAFQDWLAKHPAPVR